MHPAIDERLGGFLRAVLVAAHDVGPVHQNLAGLRGLIIHAVGADVRRIPMTPEALLDAIEGVHA